MPRFNGNPNLIWAGIGVLGTMLIVACFLYNWCDVQTFPCLKHYEKQIEEQRQFWDDVIHCACCKVDPNLRKYESAIRQVGVIYKDEHHISQFAKGDGAKVKFHNNDGYQC